MLQKIEAYMRKYHMAQAGSHIIAGVSGGADSVCLLLVLEALKEKLGYSLSVVHIEHGIRGLDSLADAEFVEDLCNRMGIACKTFHFRVPQLAAEEGLTEEEMGRKVRYQSWRDEKSLWEQKYPDKQVKIAVAHNQNDNAETMLFHLARGTGIRGLAGIPPVRDSIIRPLLIVCREEIEAYLRLQDQAYCTDRTNLQDIYSRNRIRHRILPELAKINGQAADHMSQTAAELREINEYLDRQVDKAEETCVRWKEGEVLVLWDQYQKLDQALRLRLLQKLLASLAGSRKDITRKQAVLLEGLFEKQTGRRLDLVYGLVARRTYEGICISSGQIVKKVQDRTFSFEVIEAGEGLREILKKKYTKCFDYDKIKGKVCVRTRLPGDYLVINEDGDRQKLKKYLANEKIPSEERDRLPLLADNSHIMWVVGYRISSYYKVGFGTRRILRVTCYGGQEDE